MTKELRPGNGYIMTMYGMHLSNGAHKKSPTLSEQAPERIALMRALPGLGDFLCFVPALRAIRTAFPESEISLIGLPHLRPLVHRFARYVDELLVFPGFPGLNGSHVAVPHLLDFLDQTQYRFDLAIQMHGNGEVCNQFVALLGAKKLAGFYMPGHYCPDPRTFLPYPQEEAEINRLLQLLALLGIPAQGTDLEFPLTDHDLECLLELPEASVLEPGRYVCLHTGASAAARCWSPLCFAHVADELARFGFQIVFTGTAQEQKRVEAIRQHMRYGAFDLCGRTPLGLLAALFSGACLLISNDTGVAHLATALHTPSVVLFTDSAAAHSWAPFDQQRHRVITEAKPDVRTVTAVLEQAYQLVS